MNYLRNAFGCSKDRGTEQTPTLNCDENQEEETFKRILDEIKMTMKELNSRYDREHHEVIGLIKELKDITDELESMHKATTVGSLTGAVMGAAGGITTIVGLCLTPFTFGASLAIAGVGAGIAATGGVTGAASNITNLIKQKNIRETIEKITGDFQDKIKPMTEQLRTVSTNTEKFHEQQLIFSAKGLTSINSALLVTDVLLDMALIGKVAAQAAKGLRVAAAVTGILSGLMVGLDIFCIVQDSKEIHQMNQSADERKAEDMKSETLKFIQTMRQTAAEYQTIMDNITSAIDKINKWLHSVDVAQAQGENQKRDKRSEEESTTKHSSIQRCICRRCRCKHCERKN